MARQTDPQAKATVINGWIVGICAIIAAVIAGFFALRASETQKSADAVSATATASTSIQFQTVVVTSPPIEVTREVERTIEIPKVVSVKETVPPTSTPSAIISGRFVFGCEFEDSCSWRLDRNSSIQNGYLVIPAGGAALIPQTYTLKDFSLATRVYVSGQGAFALYTRIQVPTCKNGTWHCTIQIVFDYKSQSQAYVARLTRGNSEPINLGTSTGNYLKHHEWNEILVKANGSNYEVYINQALALLFTNADYGEGAISIDNDPESTSEIRVEYVRLYKYE